MAAIPPICDFGWKAPDFVLPGTDGKTHSILGQSGANGLVVAFICNHCPYVKAIVDRMVRDANDLKAHGIGFVAICSNDAASYPEDSFAKIREFARKHAFTFPYLHDETQAVARTWKAVCTPDFFGLNARGELQYRGRLDASRREAGPADAPRDLYDAMVGVARTGKGPQDQIASMGCSIKWRD
jgi:peroxiredoxin